MKKLKIGKESYIILIVLTSIALISGLVLGLMNKITYVDETEALKAEIGKLYTSPIKEEINVESYSNIEYTQILNAFEAEDGAIIINSHSDKAYNSDGLSLLIIIKDGSITKIDGSGNGETPGLGSKALTTDYLNQFVGLNTHYYDNNTAETDETAESGNDDSITLNWDLQTNFESGSDDADSGEIAGISGATKTSTGVRYSIKAACLFYNSLEVENE